MSMLHAPMTMRPTEWPLWNRSYATIGPTRARPITAAGNQGPYDDRCGKLELGSGCSTSPCGDGEYSILISGNATPDFGSSSCSTVSDVYLISREAFGLTTLMKSGYQPNGAALVRTKSFALLLHAAKIDGSRAMREADDQLLTVLVASSRRRRHHHRFRNAARTLHGVQIFCVWQVDDNRGERTV